MGHSDYNLSLPEDLARRRLMGTRIAIFLAFVLLVTVPHSQQPWDGPGTTRGRRGTRGSKGEATVDNDDPTWFVDVVVWVYQDRAKTLGFCTCGQPWGSGEAPVQSQGKPQAKGWAKPNNSGQEQFHQLLQAVVEQLPKDQQNSLFNLAKEIPGLEEALGNKKHPDGFVQAQRDSAEASKNYRMLAEKQRHLVGKKEKLQQQLLELETEIGTTDKLLGEAEAQQKKAQKVFDDIVKAGPKKSEAPPAEEQQKGPPDEKPEPDKSRDQTGAESEKADDKEDDDNMGVPDSPEFNEYTKDLDADTRKRLDDHIEKLAEAKRRKRDKAEPGMGQGTKVLLEALASAFKQNETKRG